jgi:cytochrome c-type biogenesis protein CcmH/NrfG
VTPRRGQREREPPLLLDGPAAADAGVHERDPLRRIDARRRRACGNRAAALAESAPDHRRRAPGRWTVIRYTLIGLVVGLLLGIFIGYQAGSASSAPAGAMGGPPAMPPGMPGGAPQPATGDNFQARITAMQQVVARDPKNVEAWIQLGNDYFDTRQPQKAIEAYDRALELRPSNPNVLTDQGVMYREIGQFEKAIANFQKANQVDPKHVQSLYNIGVVYLNDMKQPKRAIEVWNKVIQIAPQSEQAAQARTAIEEAKKVGAR